MKKRLFVTATNTNIGKTYTTKLLLREFASRGLLVGAIKPIETGVMDDYAADGEELLDTIKELNPKLWSLDVSDVVVMTYELGAAPFVASKNKKLDLKKIVSKIEEMENLCDVVIIEGAGGLYVPIDDKYMMIDLIKELDAKVLLVTHCSLGCINDTLLSVRALKESGISFAVAFNCKSDEEESFSIVSEPYFLQSGFSVLKVGSDIEKICDVLYN